MRCPEHIKTSLKDIQRRYPEFRRGLCLFYAIEYINYRLSKNFNNITIFAVEETLKEKGFTEDEIELAVKDLERQCNPAMLRKGKISFLDKMGLDVCNNDASLDDLLKAVDA